MKNLKKYLAAIVCILAILFSLPTFVGKEKLSFLPNFIHQFKVNLGLDLRGGSQLLLSVDFNTYVKDQYLIYKDEIKSTLRENKIKFKSIHADEKNISFFSEEESEKIQKALRKIKLFSIENSGNEYKLVFTPKALEDMEKNIVEQTIEIVRRRVDETGTKEPTIQVQGKLQILLQMPGLEDPEHLKKLLDKTAKLTFHLVNEDANYTNIMPSDSMQIPLDNNSEKLALFKEQLVSGDMLVGANAVVREGIPQVEFAFDKLGTRKFAEVTKNNVGKRLAIVLDGKVICAPVVNSPILGGNGNITGNFTFKTASDLALLLRAGALPAPLTILEERTVGPSLGEASIAAGSRACIIGVILVMLFMILFYGLYGFFSCLSLIFNLLFIVSLLAIFGANLTMAGIAGIVLTVGMAVDANVLIFERIKEELSKGINFKIAVNRGFERAFATILDSNLTTIIAAILLYIYGTGSVRGFAVTLIIGIITSMYSAITLTRLIINYYNKIQ